MSPRIDTPEFQVIRAQTVLGECPMWCPSTQSLLWIDGNYPKYFRWKWGASQCDVWPLARPPAALAQIADGRILIAFRARIAVMNEPGGLITEVSMPSLVLNDERFNDAKVDRQGRLWIGTIDRSLNRPIGHLWRIDTDSIMAIDGGFSLSNGMALSPAGDTLYFSESFERRVYSYALDTASGELEARRLFADLRGELPKPDGLTVDADGGIWCVVFGGGCIHRYLPNGTLDRIVRLPVINPTSCMFGGPDLRTLFITTATYGLTEIQKVEQPYAGSVLAIAMDVAGIAEPLLNPDCVILTDKPSPVDGALND